jgi:hypothetical protein
MIINTNTFIVYEYIIHYYGAAFSWRSTSVAQAWLPTQDAVGRLLQFLARWRQVFNLHRRPLQGFTAAPLFLPKPSGFVPGLVVEGRRWSPLFAGGSIGPDCFSGFFFRVLSTYVEIWVALVLSVPDLFVKCTTPLFKYEAPRPFRAISSLKKHFFVYVRILKVMNP